MRTIDLEKRVNLPLFTLVGLSGSVLLTGTVIAMLFDQTLLPVLGFGLLIVFSLKEWQIKRTGGDLVSLLFSVASFIFLSVHFLMTIL